MPSSSHLIHQPSSVPSAVHTAVPSSAPPPPAQPPEPLRAAALNKAGLPRLFDPGLATTIAYTSSITLTHGPSGTLCYRGYPIDQLGKNASFDEVVLLLLYGRLPTTSRLSTYRAVLAHPNNSRIPPSVAAVISSMPRSAHPMSILTAALAAMTGAHSHLDPSIAGQKVYDDPKNVERAIELTMAVFPPLLAQIHAHTTSQQPPRIIPSATASYTERFLTLIRGRIPSSSDVALLDILLLLHADHEQNCSTSAVRHVSSSGASVFTALSSGVGALSGHLHGGAAEAAIEQLAIIGTPAGIPARLAEVRAGRSRLMGFGHRVYRAHDPRAQLLRRYAIALAERGAADDRLLAVAIELERAARADEYFVSRQLFPNVDFYSGIVYRALGFEPKFFTPLFALGRVAGWLAHWKEYLTDKDRRIARPRQHYVGPAGPLRVVPITERVDDTMGQPWATAPAKL